MIGLGRSTFYYKFHLRLVQLVLDATMRERRQARAEGLSTLWLPADDGSTEARRLCCQSQAIPQADARQQPAMSNETASGHD